MVLSKKVVCRCKLFLKKCLTNLKVNARVGRSLRRIRVDATIEYKFA